MNPHDELKSLVELFPDDPPLIERAEHIPSAMTPEPYQRLLVHDHHMTVAMESFHQSPVEVRVLDRRRDGDSYCRKIVLLKQGIEQVVQFGIVRFDLNSVAADVRNEILREDTPLGRILIAHDVMRHIDLGAILKVSAGPSLARDLQMPLHGETYGRLATIFCDGRPAVDLLEISAPLTAQFVTTRRVEFADTDMAGIIHFANYYRYMEEAEHAYFRSLGLSIMQAQPDGTVVGWPRVSASCSFEVPAYFEDVLEVRLRVARKGIKSLNYEFEFWRGETRLAHGHLKTVCCICSHGQPLQSIPIPPEYSSKIHETPGILPPL